MRTRKEMKARARKVLKAHYLLLVAVCTVAAVLGVSFNNSTNFLELPSSDYFQVEDNDDGSGHSLKLAPMMSASDVLDSLMEGRGQEGQQRAEELAERTKDSAQSIGGLEIAYKRGVLSSLVTSLSSGTILVGVFSAIHSVGFLSETAADVIFTILSLVGYLAVIVFVVSVFEQVYFRVFLEARSYRKVPLGHLAFFYKARCWANVALGLLWRDLFLTLWALTLVGFFVKYFSYRMVPLILAENPSIRPREALKLSIRMMKGHKWECFKLEFSFVGWRLLSALTSGIVGMLYYYPYLTATMAEYYAELRRAAREANVKGAQALNDKYLFTPASHKKLEHAYQDILDLERTVTMPEPRRKTTVGALVADVFGVVWRTDETEDQYRRFKQAQRRLLVFRDALAQEVYPQRLSPLQIQERTGRFDSFMPERHYSITSLVLIFMAASIFGWVFEVGMHLLTDGEFVNRGVLAGPWLPIYGTGIVLFLMVLNKIRNRPALLFVCAMVCAECLEYGTSVLLELLFDGAKWWDYSGYFLNLDGRICAEGLLTFGLGGLAGTYVVAPVLDNLANRLPKQVAVALAACLLALLAVDAAMSIASPNSGEGVTTVTGMEEGD